VRMVGFKADFIVLRLEWGQGTAMLATATAVAVAAVVAVESTWRKRRCASRGGR